MVIYTTNMLAAPLLLAVWAIDVYLGIIAVRWLFAGNPGVAAAFARIADVLPERLDRVLSRWGHGRVRIWVPWLLVVVGCWVLRNSLLRLAIEVR